MRLRSMIIIFFISCIVLARYYGVRKTDVQLLQTSRFGDIVVNGSDHKSGLLVIHLYDDKNIINQTSQLLDTVTKQGNVVAHIPIEQFLKHDTSEEMPACYEYSGELSRLSQVIQSELRMENVLKAVLVAEGIKSSALLYGMQKYIYRDVYSSLALSNSLSTDYVKSVCIENDQLVDITHMGYQNKIESFNNFNFINTLTDQKGLSEVLSCNDTSCPFLQTARVALSKMSHELPIVEEIPEKIQSTYFVIFLSGDGGWATIDKEITDNLVKRGIPVIGVDSLKYFWKEKSPEVLSSDMNKLIHMYRSKLKIDNIALIGFSLGANMVPFIINRLDEDNKIHLKYFSLLNPTVLTEFEIHFTDWIPGNVPETGVPIIDEVIMIKNVPGSCIKGSEEESSLCNLDLGSHIEKLVFEGTHHYNGTYDLVSEALRMQFNKYIH